MSRLITLFEICIVCFLVVACVRTGSQDPGGSVQYTLAVFPWQVIHEYNSGSHPFDLTMSEFQDVLDESAFVPTFSFYNLRQSTTTIRERPGIENLWRGRDFLKEPDHQIVFQLGKELGVDAVITYSVAELHDTDYLYVYLFDIVTQTVHRSDGTSGNFTREAPVVLAGMTQSVFTKFYKNRARRSQSAHQM